MIRIITETESILPRELVAELEAAGILLSMSALAILELGESSARENRKLVYRPAVFEAVIRDCKERLCREQLINADIIRGIKIGHTFDSLRGLSITYTPPLYGVAR